MCGAPARGVPPAAQLCTKAAWHCLAWRARPALRPLFSVRGRRGSPLSTPSPPLLFLPTPHSQAGQLRGIELPAPSSAAVAAAARTVTLATFTAIYIHTIGFHSWNQGLVCLCAGALVAKVPQLYADGGLGSGADCPAQTCAERGRPRPFSQASGRGRSLRIVSPFPSLTSHPFPYNCWPFVPGSGKVSWATNRLGSMDFFPLAADRQRTPREDIGFCFKNEPSCWLRAALAQPPPPLGGCTCWRAPRSGLPSSVTWLLGSPGRA